MVPTTTRMASTVTATICVSIAIGDDAVSSEDGEVDVALYGGIDGDVPDRSGFST